MAEKYINKVVYGENTLIDLTADTVVASDVLSGKTLHVATGAPVTGTMPNNGAMNQVLDETTTSKTIPAGYTTGGTVSHTTVNVPNPTVTLDSTNGKVTAAGSWTKGFTTNNSYTNDLQLSTVTGATITPGTAEKTAVAAGKYTLGAVKVAGDADLVAANIKDGVNIFGVAGTFSDSATVSSGQAAAAAGNILTGKSAFLDGAELKGTMPNNGATGTTITTQGGEYTIPAGYTSGGTVKAQIAASVLDNTIIAGEAIEEATGDFAWKSTVTIPAGFHNNQTLTKTFSEVFPAPETPATASQMLAGYQAYNKSGVLMTGTMPNNGAISQTINTQGGTYTVPAGYTSGGTVTANINAGAITSGAGTATISDPSYNSTSGKFDQTASGTVAAPTVGTAGYVSSSAGTKTGNSISGSKALNKIAGSTAITGTAKVTPAISKQAFTISGVIDAASGNATTTAPTSGVYVKVKSAAAENTLTATPSVTTAGYGTSAQHGITGNTVAAGANASADTYVPITEGALSAADSSISGATFTPTLTYNSTNANFDFGGSANATGTAYAKASTAGYVTSAKNTSKSLSATVSATGTVNKVGTGVDITGTTTKVPAISRQAISITGVTDAASGAATTTAPTSGVYVKVNSAANTGTLTATPKVTSAGYGTTTQYGATAGTKSVGAAASADTYVPITTTEATVSGRTVSYGSGWITAGSKQVNVGTITASGSKTQSTPSISINSSGLITASVAAADGSVTPTVTTAGYVSSTEGTKTAGTFTMGASSNTKQLTTKAATTITPSTSAQTAVNAGVYTTGDITVAAIPYSSVENPQGGLTVTIAGV